MLAAAPRLCTRKDASEGDASTEPEKASVAGSGGTLGDGGDGGAGGSAGDGDGAGGESGVGGDDGGGSCGRHARPGQYAMMAASSG